MSIYKDFEARLDLEAISKGRASSRTAELALAENLGGDPILGVQYSCDYRYEEEAGAGTMAELFTRTADTDSFFAQEYLLQDGSKGLIEQTTQAELVLETEELIAFQASHYAHRIPEELEAALSYLEKAQRRADGRASFTDSYWHTTAADLKALAKSRGLKGYSKLKRDELVKLNADFDFAEKHKDDGPSAVEIISQPGYFHNGDILVFQKRDTLFSEVLSKLVEAARAGYLVVGSGGIDAFGSGFSLFDSRDLTDESMERISANNRWYREQMELLKPVAEIVKAGPMGGYYALGRPTLRENGTVVYWLNGYGVRLPTGKSSQPSGYYSLEDLLAEKHMADLRVRADEDFKRFDERGNYRKTPLTDAEAEVELKARGLSWASK